MTYRDLEPQRIVLQVGAERLRKETIGVETHVLPYALVALLAGLTFGLAKSFAPSHAAAIAANCAILLAYVAFRLHSWIVPELHALRYRDGRFPDTVLQRVDYEIVVESARGMLRGPLGDVRRALTTYGAAALELGEMGVVVCGDQTTFEWRTAEFVRETTWVVDSVRFARLCEMLDVETHTWASPPSSRSDEHEDVHRAR